MIIIGHRGAKAYEPGNTLLSIKKAIELGVNVVEIDVHLSKDNSLVVIHDEKVDRTTNSKGYVNELSLEELKKLDAGKGQKIPTLQEVISFVNKKVKLLIELKGKNTEKSVVRIIEKNSLFNHASVISFWHDMVKKVKKLNNKIETGILLVGNPVNPSRLIKDANADFLTLDYKFVNKKLVDDIHKNNLKVFVWNIDDKDEIEKYAKLGVDGIGSNKPDILVKYFKG